MIVAGSTALEGLGAAVPRRQRKITLEPITIEGKVPPKPFPWKWLLIGLGVAGAAFLVYRSSSSKKGRKGRRRRGRPFARAHA